MKILNKPTRNPKTFTTFNELSLKQLSYMADRLQELINIQFSKNFPIIHKLSKKKTPVSLRTDPPI